VIAPDLRGHGDSEWARGASYTSLEYVYDIAQLVEQENLGPVNIIGHSLGGMIACLYAGVFPEKVASLISIEGVGGYWQKLHAETHPQTRIREWIDQSRTLAGRVPRRYPDLGEALQRMQSSNPHLSEERAEHLTIHGSNRNEDGTYSWKFDNYTHAWLPLGLTFEETQQLWEQISCPTLLLNAKQGMEHRTGQDDSLKHFKHGELIDIDNAGHWLHHDQFDEYIDITRAFLAKHAHG
jgi:pimeloyl-ACP methyl ester carboxylesterase